MQLARYRSAARNRDFALLLIGRSVSWYGNALAPMAIVFAVLDLRLSVDAVSIAVLSRSVPQLVLVLVGGALADRRHPRRILVAGTTVAACSQGLLALTVITDHATLWWICGLSGINGVAAALAGPAAGSLFRSVVREEDWHASSVLDRSGQQLGLTLGLSTGGVMIGWSGPGMAIAVDATTFIIGAVCYLLIRYRTIAADSMPSLASQLVSGFVYLRRSSWFVALTVQSLVTSIAVACCLQVLAAVVADETFGRAGLGIASSLQTVGGVVGLMIAGVLPAARRLPGPILLGGVLGLPIMVLGVGPRLFDDQLLLMTYAAALLIAGTAGGLAGIWRNLFVLQHVPGPMMGRVTGYGLVASIGGLSVGEALAGPLHQLLGTSGALFAIAILVVGSVVWAISRREVRALAYSPPEG